MMLMVLDALGKRRQWRGEGRDEGDAENASTPMDVDQKRRYKEVSLVENAGGGGADRALLILSCLGPM